MQTLSDARISPVFRYKDAPAAIDWLVRAYGFIRHEIHHTPEGGIAHAELRRGTAAIGLSSAGPVDAENPWSSVRHGVYVCIADVDAQFTRAEAAGASIAQSPRDTDYGSREFSVHDVGGHLWSFGTYGMASPAGKPSLFVGLHYREGRAASRWLRDAFGFTPELQVPGDHGKIIHAELRLGRDYIIVSAAPRTSGHWRDETQCTYVWVDDVDEHWSRALHTGAHIVEAPHDTPYGARAYYTTDPEGFLWSFTTYRPGDL